MSGARGPLASPARRRRDPAVRSGGGCHRLESGAEVDRSERPTLSDGCFSALGERRIQVRGEIASCDGKLIRFVDGSVSEVDVIAWATGYRPAFPFLDSETLGCEPSALELYRRIAHPTRPACISSALRESCVLSGHSPNNKPIGWSKSCEGPSSSRVVPCSFGRPSTSREHFPSFATLMSSTFDAIFAEPVHPGSIAPSEAGGSTPTRGVRQCRTIIRTIPYSYAGAPR